MQYLIMCRSLTNAQRASAFLERKGINSTVIKAPQSLSAGGCGYALSIYKHLEEATRLLRNNNLLSGKRYMRFENGEYVEVHDDIS